MYLNKIWNSEVLGGGENQKLSGNPKKQEDDSKPTPKVLVNTVNFTVNNVAHTINDSEIGPSMSLAQYVREVACLTGTKISCGEGGCGACIVTVQKFEGDKPRSLNSCLTPVLSCDGWSITTVEGLGGKDDGYHPIQTALAANGGTQCGYCSPGMVMQLYSWLQEHPQATKEEIDNILDGNICRCTGYRPILEAFKSFAADNPNRKDLVADIEDLQICSKSGKPCSGGSSGGGSCHGSGSSCSGSLKSSEEFSWHSPTTVAEVQSILASLAQGTKYRIVAGNTGTGVFKDDGPYSVYININKVTDLYEMTGSPLVLGANVTITNAINFLRESSDSIWVGVANHLMKIASYGIRNQGTLAGNLMMKNGHNDFPSDVFLSLTTVGVTLEILNADGSVEDVVIDAFPSHDMERKLITKIKFPDLSKTMEKKKDINSLWLQASGKPKAGQEWKYRSFKIMPRSSNAHAYVNAGFLALVDTDDNFKIVEKPRIVFGGINASFIHATATEEFLIGRNMNDHSLFLEALTILADELVPEEDPVLATPLYRKQLAMGLFYKFFLFVLGDSTSSGVQSGATDLQRGVSSGQQDWETDESQWPVSEAIEKIEAKIQCAGEAEYINDMPAMAGELHAAFVLTNRANCDIVSVDKSTALGMDGVVAYVDANDVPGANDWRLNVTPEPVFCTGHSEYAGQAVGLIVAKTREIAISAAKTVVIQYENMGEVVVDMEKAAEVPANVVVSGGPLAYGDIDAALAGADTVVSGRFRMGSQYHFHMETHVCIAVPNEDGFDLWLPTQDINGVQKSVSKNLNIPFNSINVSVKRLGGAYGGKIELPNAVASATTVAANKLRKPIRLWLPMEDNMKLFGKRNPYFFDYSIGFDSNRKIVGVRSDVYADGGWNFNGVDSVFACIFGQSCYHIPALKFTPYGVKTHLHTHTATRAPGMVNGHAMLEAIMEHAAVELGVEPLQLRTNNLMEIGSPTMPPPTTLDTDCPISGMIETLSTSAEYLSRKQAVTDFNQANRWKKRGISMVPMRYDHSMVGFGIKFHCLISVYAGDGTIAVTVGGIEMGQGLYTKVAQVIAKQLGVDMSYIKVKATAAITSPNNIVTGGSMGSESCCMAGIKAAEMLNANLAPVKDKLGASATWPEIIAEANNMSIDLCASYMMTWEKDGMKNYSVWAVVVTEVEVDILTGELFTVRTDILEDAGLSTSPQVDIGQVEGAFMMGLGLWTSEEVKHDPATGQLLTMNTWEYKPPAAKDIPQDLRVTLMKNSRNPNGVLSSKATGEPALLTSISVLFAIRNALNSSRQQAGLSGWWQLNGPATVEKIHQHSGIKPDQFIF